VSLLPIYNLEKKTRGRRRRTDEEETNNGSHTMCFLSTASFVLLGARKEKCFHPNGPHTRSLSLSLLFLFSSIKSVRVASRGGEREGKKRTAAAATTKTKKKKIVATWAQYGQSRRNALSSHIRSVDYTRLLHCSKRQKEINSNELFLLCVCVSRSFAVHV
jgi:hypothetical protein